MDSVLHSVGWLLFGFGWLLCFFGWLWILLLGWQRNIWWGVACFFIPVFGLVYVAAHWKESREAFFLQLGGVGFWILAAVTGVPGR
jgi:hypothetical protein